MNKKCLSCNLVNFAQTEICRRCGADLNSSQLNTAIANKAETSSLNLIWRGVICLTVCVFAIFAFYFSLILTSSSLHLSEKQQVTAAIKILEEKGFEREVFLLNYFTTFRNNDHWLNASVEKENAYAATNFPFEIMTLYPDFFHPTFDDTERAAILLHEAQHLKGADEKEAYEYVWRNRKKLGWTKQNYGNSKLWEAVKKQTKEYAPNLFICESGDLGDCTDF